MRVIYKNKAIDIDVKECSALGRVRGLMFRKVKKAENLLLFNFKKPVKWKIHSYFVFFDFLAVWLDEDNYVLEIKRVKPFRLSVGAKKSFYKMIEIPLNKKNENIFHFFVGRGKV